MQPMTSHTAAPAGRAPGANHQASAGRTCAQGANDAQ